jgi:hypothetical protein
MLQRRTRVAKLSTTPALAVFTLCGPRIWSSQSASVVRIYRNMTTLRLVAAQG